jgi:hypothetical protein
MYNYSQNSFDIIISAPGVKTDGTQATTLAIDSFTTAIIDVDGAALSNYTEPTITNPLSNGNYVFNFLTSANSPAFIEVNTNQYYFTMDHPETDVDPWGPIPVYITDRLQGDLSKQADVTSIAAQVNSIDSKISLDVSTIVDLTNVSESMPRIERLDTYQFIKSFGTVPNSVGVDIYFAPGDPSSNTLVATGTATQSGTSANFYFFYTDNGSNYTTVDSSGFHFIQWTAYRTTGNDRERDYFEIIRTD